MTTLITQKSQNMHVPDAEMAANTKSNFYNEAPTVSWDSFNAYFGSRISTLFDIPIRHEDKTWWQVLNPVPGLKEMTKSDWNFYFLGFFAWCVDAMDFFCVSASASAIAKSLNVSIAEISWGVTLVLMLRAIGAGIFGLISDYYGRKIPYIVICVLFMVVEIGSGFVTSYTQFLGVRSIFGILMGAMYPIASTTALESQPKRAKSILSGLFLPGYNLGYIFAVAFYRAFEFTKFEGKIGDGWRNLFFFTGGVPMILIIWRICSPESSTFIKLNETRKILALERKHQQGTPSNLREKFKSFTNGSLLMTLKTEWLMIIYLILMMSGFCFLAHGSQDLYPTLLEKQHGVTPNQRTTAMVVINFGGIFGGIFFGQLTELFGRRLTICICMVFSAAFLYPAYFSTSITGLTIGCFFLFFGTVGSWGIAPLHLLELVNNGHRAFLSGVLYQLGNLASSASFTIEAQMGTKFPLPHLGKDAYDYGKVMCLFMSAVLGYLLIIMLIGPERFHKNFEIDLDTQVSYNELMSETDAAVATKKENTLVDYREV